MKRIISIVTILTILLTSTVITVMANDAEQKGDFLYAKDSNKIVAYVGESGICEIPENSVVSSLHNHNLSTPITKLIVNKNVTMNMTCSGELQRLDSLKEAELKEGVTEIPEQFLQDCPSLEKISLPSTVTRIENEAFMNCPKLKSVKLPDGLISIGEYSFSNLPSLSGDVIIPDTVTSMGMHVFENCGDLNKVHISDNLTYKPSKNYNGSENYAYWFSRTKIHEINIPKAMLDNPTCYFLADEITFDSDMTVNIYNVVKDSDWCHFKYLKGKTNKSVGNYDGFAIVEDTVLKYIGTDKNPVVPEGVKTIGENAFTYCDIDTVGLPQSLTKIDDAAFQLSTIKSIIIPKNVKHIGSNAFDMCALLEYVTFEGNPDVEGNAFEISNVLTEDNLIFKENAPQLKKKILSFGFTEIELPFFYSMINQNRNQIGFKEIYVPDEYRQNSNDKITTSQKPIDTPKATKPAVSEKPQPTEVPRETTRPSSTPKPTEAPKSLTVQDGEAITVSVDGKAIAFPDAQPFVDDSGRTQVPVRAVSELLDCKVDWQQENQTAVITKDNGDIVKITLYSDIMMLNDTPIKMDTSAIIKDNRTFIPVRFVAEALGLQVEWIE